jgi:2-dehydropantoate 2-reductase
MKLAVMGAGAVGAYFGGMLARAGHEVVLIGRAAHVEAIERGGLRMETRSFDERVRVGASTEPSAVAGARLVLLAVKSSDTESACASIAPHLDRAAIVLSLQNGVDNAERASQVLQRRVVPAVVYVATEMAGPGHVKHHGRGELVVAPFEGSDEVVPAFAQAGVPVQVSDDVVGALWAKLILNCAYNALSAIAQLPYGRLVESEGVAAVMRDVVCECVAVAEAEGIVLPGDPWTAVQKLAPTMPAQFSSTAQDVQRGKASEIDHLNGYVVRRGEARGIATPVNRVLQTLVRLIESKRAR